MEEGVIAQGEIKKNKKPKKLPEENAIMMPTPSGIAKKKKEKKISKKPNDDKSDIIDSASPKKKKQSTTENTNKKNKNKNKNKNKKIEEDNDCTMTPPDSPSPNLFSREAINNNNNNENKEGEDEEINTPIKKKGLLGRAKKNVTGKVATSAMGKKVLAEILPAAFKILEYIKQMILIIDGPDKAKEIERNLLKASVKTALLYNDKQIPSKKLNDMKLPVLRVWSCYVDYCEMEFSVDVPELAELIAGIFPQLGAVLKPHVKPTNYQLFETTFAYLASPRFLYAVFDIPDPDGNGEADAAPSPLNEQLALSPKKQKQIKKSNSTPRSSRKKKDEKSRSEKLQSIRKESAAYLRKYWDDNVTSQEKDMVHRIQADRSTSPERRSNWT